MIVTIIFKVSYGYEREVCMSCNANPPTAILYNFNIHSIALCYNYLWHIAIIDIYFNC